LPGESEWEGTQIHRESRHRWSMSTPCTDPTCKAGTVLDGAALLCRGRLGGHRGAPREAQIRAPLCEEAIRLARILLRLFNDEPEIMGLLALMLLQHARTQARLDAHGDIVLLQDQDRRLWDRPAYRWPLASR